MGAIANAIVDYAQPLLDQTDGDVDKINRAMTVAQMCWNLALFPEEEREAAIDKLEPAMNMTDGEFAEFRQHIVLPMIQRHREMFPGMHEGSKQKSKTVSVASSPPEGHRRTGRNAPCLCGSGRKYKLCCWRK